MAASNDAPKLSETAVAIKGALAKNPRTPAVLAERIGRASARGIGPSLAALVKYGVAVKSEDGYAKAPKA